MIPLALFVLAGCIAIGSGSDRIVAGDIAPAVPDLASLPADTPLALAPAPGVQRVFRVPELQRLAARFNVTASPASDVCFERPLSPINPARMLEAMQRQLPEARIEILEHSRFNVPEGEMEFPLTGLRTGPVVDLWNGAVRYAVGRRFVIWAKVKVVAPAQRVIAVESLKSGQVIGAAQLRMETRESFPAAGVFAASIKEAAGHLLRHPVAAGEAIQKQWLQNPLDVSRGDTVHVEVRSGSAVLQFEGQAETGGSAGQNISVLNPSSKKRFLARVEGKGKVTVGKGI
jgi:flagella basal body P-ring formation protein FlgA